MWRHVRRYAWLAYLNLSEAVLRSFGRRPPYGILKIELAGELSEEPAAARLFSLPQRRPDDHFGILAALRWAREDRQVRAVLVCCGDLRAGWAKVQELRRSLAALRAAGKRVWVYLAHAGMREYLLASAADQLLVAPAGTVDVAGLSTEVTFVAGALEKLGIEAELVQMGKYKSAGESFTRRDMSAAHREMAESLIQDVYEQVTETIAEGRRMQPAAVRALIDRGPFTAREALQEGLIDGVLYADEAEEKLRAACQQAAVIGMRDYRARRGRWVQREVVRRRGRTVGLLHLTGTVKLGESIPGPAVARACGAASVARDLQELREAKDVDAVIVRISSPGGSGLASDLIWHEVARTRALKPVVVSFGDVAASGGYYVGVAGNPVVAEGATVTGSIGVLAGKPVLRGLYDHLGITKEVVSRGRHAALYSDYVALGAEERQRLQAEAEYFYADFVEKVASGRRLSAEAVGAVAEGRVWTGRQALARGLIDHLGGLDTALEHARRLIGVPPDAPVSVRRYPKPARLWKLNFSITPTRAHLRAAVPWLSFIGRERIWAVLPFRIRFL